MPELGRLQRRPRKSLNQTTSLYGTRPVLGRRYAGIQHREGCA